jgi:alginate O-acetyltransferase complex protein AlgJ
MNTAWMIPHFICGTTTAACRDHCMSGVNVNFSPKKTSAGRQSAINQMLRKWMAILFLAAIAAPAIGTWMQWDPWHRLNEKRQLAAFPQWPQNVPQAESFLPGFLSYFRDHFGFRDTLIHELMLVKIGLLHASGNPSVIIGDEGWLFLRLKDGSEPGEFNGLAPLSESELHTWQATLSRRRDWLAARHISYLVVLVPDKQSIYPEFLPATIRKEQSEQWMDQLIDRIHRSNSPVQILDLRPDLLNAKRRVPVFWKSDTHWNQYGIYIGYQAIMREVRRILPDKPLMILGPNDFMRFRARGVSGDLGQMLGAPELFDEPFEAIVPLQSSLPTRGPTDRLYITTGDPGLPRLVMYHDSFGDLLIPLLARSYSYGAFYWGKHNMGKAFIDSQKPDLVIDEFAERFLNSERWEQPEITEQSNPNE